MKNRYDGAMEPSAQLEIKLRPRYEALALKLGQGVDGGDAYFELFNCHSGIKGRQFKRLVGLHPEILLRAEQIRYEVHTQGVRRAAMTKADVQEAILENIEHAKTQGRPVVNKLGEVVAWQRNHSAVNQGLALIANINGLTMAQRKKKDRGEEDPVAALSADQLVGSILRKYAAIHGKGMDDVGVEGLERIAASAGDGSGPGPADPEPVEVLPPLPKTETVP